MILSPNAHRLEQPPTASPAATYHAVRQLSESLCQPLVIEDYGVQSMADVSPPKWHLAHTTWFFETFLLVPYLGAMPSVIPAMGTCSTPTTKRWEAVILGPNGG